MAEDPKPPARRLALKPKEIEPTETRALPGDGTAISVELIHAQNRVAEQKARALQPPPDTESAEADELLRRNRAAAMRAQFEPIAMPAPRPARRHRDMAMIVAFAAGLCAVLLYVFRHDKEFAALAITEIILMVLVLAWVVYGIMDRY